MELLTIGPTHELEAGVVYALPARKVFAYSDGVLEIANENDGSAFVAVAASTTGVEIAATFVRTASTTTPALVTLKV